MSEVNSQLQTKNFLISIVSDKTAEEIKADFEGYLASHPESKKDITVHSAKQVLDEGYASIDEVNKSIELIEQYLTMSPGPHPIDSLYELVSLNGDSYDENIYNFSKLSGQLIRFFLDEKNLSIYNEMTEKANLNLGELLPALQTFFDKLDTSLTATAVFEKVDLHNDKYHQRNNTIQYIEKRYTKLIKVQQYEKGFSE